ncbi:MAG: hydroxyisourate hydrolase [Paracoccaceae bacterium]|nr:hydroxyisourate hydrolase [Paracoccaceae bacterium]
MAVVSSHTLNGVDGTHAGGIAVRLRNLATSEMLFDTTMDDGGRLVQDIGKDLIDPAAKYELVFATGAYWQAKNISRSRVQIMDEVVVRFAIPDTTARYHIPVILSPNSYSIWWS